MMKDSQVKNKLLLSNRDNDNLEWFGMFDNNTIH